MLKVFFAFSELMTQPYQSIVIGYSSNPTFCIFAVPKM
jgi:hypothetical protein